MGSGIMRIVMGVITIVVAFILFPILLTAVAGIANTANASLFTGLTSVNSIVPLILLVGMIFSGGMITWGGVKGTPMGTGQMMNLIGGIVTIFIGLTLFPIIMTSCFDLYTTAGSTYTGFQAILKVVPLILLIGFVMGGGLLMWKGAKGGGVGGGRRSRRVLR